MHRDRVQSSLGINRGATMRVPVVRFEAVVGSTTSKDGKTFFYRVRHENGTEAMLGFPHREISKLVETAAMQMENGKEDGRNSISAFKTGSFVVGRGPKGGMVLSMVVGEVGKINFLVTHEMAGQLAAALVRGPIKH